MPHSAVSDLGLHCLPRSIRWNNSIKMTPGYLSLVTRKPVVGVCNQLKLKPACSATQISSGLEISATVSRGIILSRQWTTKVLIRLRKCAGWSAPLLFAYGINWFFHDVAHFIFFFLFLFQLIWKINANTEFEKPSIFNVKIQFSWTF